MFLAIFEIAKNGIWSKKIFFMKLIYLISRVFLAWTFKDFLAHCDNINTHNNYDSYCLGSFQKESVKEVIICTQKRTCRTPTTYT